MQKWTTSVALKPEQVADRERAIDDLNSCVHKYLKNMKVSDFCISCDFLILYRRRYMGLITLVLVFGTA